MKATLTFTLPEENEEFRMASNAVSYAAGLDNIRNEVRKINKYREFQTEEARSVVEEIYQIVCENCRDDF